jgi:hypothetical protein
MKTTSAALKTTTSVFLLKRSGDGDQAARFVGRKRGHGAHGHEGFKGVVVEGPKGLAGEETPESGPAHRFPR